MPADPVLLCHIQLRSEFVNNDYNDRFSDPLVQ